MEAIYSFAAHLLKKMLHFGLDQPVCRSLCHKSAVLVFKQHLTLHSAAIASASWVLQEQILLPRPDQCN